LKQAQEALSRQRDSEVRQQVEQLQREAGELAQRQEEVVRDLGRIEPPADRQNPGDDFFEQLRDLYWRKQGLQQDLQGLETRLHQAARRMASDEPAAAEKLKQAGVSIRDQRLTEKMQEGSELLAGGMVQLAERREQAVAEELHALEERIAEAQRALGTGGGQDTAERLRQALAEAGSLAEKLESLKARAEAGQRSGQDDGRQAAEAGREGQEQGREAGGRTRSTEAGETPGERSGSSGGVATVGGPGGENQDLPDSVSRFAGSGYGGGIDPQSADREWRQRLREAEELRQSLEGADPNLASEAARLARRMRELQLEKILADPDEVARLKSQIIDGIHQLELQISRALREGRDDYLRPVGEEEIPPEFRARVEEYYRRLAARPR
jgi:hypothetical protein